MSVRSNQQQFNRQSRAAFDLYAPHRARVMSLLLSAPERRSLCVLGAGNCNDLDLSRLLAEFESVTLVDLDPEALLAGAELQQAAGHPRLKLAGDVDLSGVNRLLDDPPEQLQPDWLQSLSEQAAAASFPALPAECSVVVSVGLLSQLIHSVLSTGLPVASLLPVIQAVRRRHLQLLLELAVPGGRGCLVTEVVSSDSTPGLDQVREEQLPAFLAQQLATGNFFTGLHPGLLLQQLRDDSRLNALIEEIRPASPWLWPFISRTYAVTAWTMIRRRLPSL